PTRRSSDLGEEAAVDVRRNLQPYVDHHRTVDVCLIFDTTSITPRSLRLRGFFVAAHGFHTGVPFALKACAELFQNHVSIFCLPCLPCRPCALRGHQKQRSRKQVSFREREGYALPRSHEIAEVARATESSPGSCCGPNLRKACSPSPDSRATDAAQLRIAVQRAHTRGSERASQ